MERFIKANILTIDMDLQNQDKPLEVLVIDDDEGVRLFLSNSLEFCGSNVTLASDGQEGIDKYTSMYQAGTPYDLVLTDLNMPRKSGVDVVREIKTLSPTTPVYVVTGREAGQAYQSLATQLGELKPDDVVQKPFNLRTLMNIIGSVRAKRK